jgi:hypothetical protein
MVFASSSVPLKQLGAREITDSSRLKKIQNEIIEICDSRDSARFPGSQPVSFNKQSLQDIRFKPYVVCEKSDGQRFFLLSTVTSSEDSLSRSMGDIGPTAARSYLIDRDFKVYQVSQKKNKFFMNKWLTI